MKTFAFMKCGKRKETQIIMRSIYEIKAQKILEAEGFRVDYKIRPRICPRGYSVDYWGLFDLLAYKNGVIRFISVKGKAGVPQKHRKMIEGFNEPAGCTKEIWVFRKRGLDMMKLGA